MAQQSGHSAGSGGASGAPNPYLKTKIQTATPAELRLMLLDGAIKFSELGREGLIEKNYEKSFTSINRAEDIVMELLESLRPEVDPAMCAKLNDLYLYLYLQLVRASSERDIAVMDNVVKLLKFERETWSLVMKKLDVERFAGSASSQPTANSAATGSLSTGRAAISMHG